MDTAPRINDTDNNLLFKICALIDSGAVGGGSVFSFNGRTGAISLLLADVTALVDSRYVLKAGDTMTGALVLPSGAKLLFGGTGATHPALKDVGALLQLRLGDDSNYATLQSGFTQANIVDTGTNTTPVALELYHDTSSGTPAASLGVALDFRADSSTTDRQLQCRIVSLWTDATHGTRTSQFRFSPTLNGTSVECFRLTPTAADLRNGAALQISGVAYANPISVYAAGTVYTLTATSAAVDFGTTDPAITVSAAGTYAVRPRVKVALNGATFAANRTLTVKLRRTNNTPGDVSNSTTTYVVPITTTLTNTLATIDLPEVLYTTANSNDVLTIFADVSVLPTAGSISIDEASIVAVRLL